MNARDIFRQLVVWVLTKEARLVLAKYKARVVVVTGSVGKTSTKDALYAALKTHTFVRKSEKSYNSDIGVPLTVLGVPNGWGNAWRWVKNVIEGALLMLMTTPYPRWLVIELGADRPGDISRTLRWVVPDVVVCTTFPSVPVHVEFYESPQAVVAEEMFPVQQLRPGGVAVLNADDLAQRSLAVPDGVRVVTYGFAKGATVRGSRYHVSKKNGLATGITFDVHYDEASVSVQIPGVIGKTHAMAVLAGIAGAVAAGAPFEKMGEIGGAYEAPPGRLHLVPGRDGSLILDDTYNASPRAAEEALAALTNATHAGKRIAVLGDMLELGKYSAEAHEQVGALVPASADLLVTVGVRARGIAAGALKSGLPETSIVQFERGSDAADYLLKEIKKGDVILIKGSQGMRLERVVAALMKDPADAPRLLARQDPEWLMR